MPVHRRTELNLSDDQIKDYQAEYVHRLGNLTLTPYNPELGQKSFVDKRDQVDNEKYVGLRLPLFLNESISEDGSIENKISWSDQDIVRRSEFLAKKL